MGLGSMIKGAAASAGFTAQVATMLPEITARRASMVSATRTAQTRARALVRAHPEGLTDATDPDGLGRAFGLDQPQHVRGVIDLGDLHTGDRLRMVPKESHLFGRKDVGGTARIGQLDARHAQLLITPEFPVPGRFTIGVDIAQRGDEWVSVGTSFCGTGGAKLVPDSLSRSSVIAHIDGSARSGIEATPLGDTHAVSVQAIRGRLVVDFHFGGAQRVVAERI